MQSDRITREPSVIGRDEESLGELFGELAGQSAALVKDEITLVKQELQEKFELVQKASLLMLTGAVMGLLALMAILAAAILAFAIVVGFWQSALIVGLVLLLLGVITFYAGFKRAGRSLLKPRQTIETLEENKEWLKEMT